MFNREELKLKYVDKWGLSNLEDIKINHNNVYYCDSKYGRSILKISVEPDIILNEYNTLAEYDGKYYVKPYEFSRTDSVLLEEYIDGDMLKDIDDLEQKIDIFSYVWTNLHIDPIFDTYPTYMDWINQKTKYMSKQKFCRELYLHMRRAQRIGEKYFAKYSDRKLLHGDLHHNNIIVELSEEGSNDITIIDPKGVIGPKVFDLPRFLLNEYYYSEGAELNNDLINRVNDIIILLEENIEVPQKVMRELLYMEAAMAFCTGIEMGRLHRYPSYLGKMEFTQKILKM